MTIYYAKKVTTQSYQQGVLKFTLASTGHQYAANWADDVEPSVSAEHDLAPTIVTPGANKTGWLWLSRAWVGDNGVYQITDPKRPKALGVGDVYYKTHARVASIDATLVLDEDRNRAPIKVNLFDNATVSLRHEIPPVSLGEKFEVWLSGALLRANADVDFEELDQERDLRDAEAAAAALERILEADHIDPLLLVEYTRARLAAEAILKAHAGLGDSTPPSSLVQDWKRLARAAKII